MGVAVPVAVGDGVIVGEGVIEGVAVEVALGVGVLPLKEQATLERIKAAKIIFPRNFLFVHIFHYSYLDKNRAVPLRETAQG